MIRGRRRFSSPCSWSMSATAWRCPTRSPAPSACGPKRPERPPASPAACKWDGAPSSRSSSPIRWRASMPRRRWRGLCSRKPSSGCWHSGCWCGRGKRVDVNCDRPACRFVHAATELLNELEPIVLAKHRDSQVGGLGELRAGARPGDHVVGLFGYRSSHLGAEALGHALGLVARHLLQCSSEHHGLAGDGGVLRRLLGLENAYMPGQPLDDAAIVCLAEIGGERIDDGRTDLIEGIHLLARLCVVFRDLHAGLVKRSPRAIAARERPRRGFSHVADAERIDEAFERDRAARRDRAEQVADGNFAVAFDLFKLELTIAFFEREDVGRLLDDVALEEKRDLLFAQAVDIEGAARYEVLKVLYFLERTRELAAATSNGAFVAGRSRVANHGGLQRAGADLREIVRLGTLGPFLRNDAEHLRDHIAGTLDHHRIAKAHIQPRDLVGIVQGGVLHHYATDRHRLELGDRRQRARAADLDLDRLDQRRGLFGRELVRDGPARRA